MTPQFLYFDMGNVLLWFDHHRGARQMAQVAGVAEEQIWDIVFASPLELNYEAGQITSRQFHEAVCQRLFPNDPQHWPDYDAFLHAGSAIFEVNVSMKPVLGMLQSAGYRTGILSSTNEAHWSYVTDGRYAGFPQSFDALALSYQIGAVKPDERIYVAAAKLAGAAPQEIFFVDDKPENVAAALRLGIDAVLYTTTPVLVADLRRRGLRFNY